MGSLNWLLGIVLVGFASKVARENERKRREKAMVIETTLVQSGFEKVAQAFRMNFEEGREEGAQMVCIANGKKVVEMYGGKDQQSMMDKDKFAVIFSCTKVVESLVVAMLVDRGVLRYEDPVGKFWPEFGSLVGDHVTVRDLMTHQGGVSAIDKAMSLQELVDIMHDGEKIGQLLSENKAEWRPTNPPSRQRYHAVTRGMYVAEILRRVDGRGIEAFVQEEIICKVNGKERAREEAVLHIGCPPHLQDRVVVHRSVQSKLFLVVRAILHFIFPAALLRFVYEELDRLKDFELDVIRSIGKKETQRAFAIATDAPRLPADIANNRVIRTAPLVSAMGITNANTLAMIGGEIVSPNSKLLSSKGFEAARGCNGPVLRDEILCRSLKMSDCGWGLDRFEAFGCAGWVGWAGMGGSMFVFHPETESVFAYVVSGFEAQQYKARGVRLLKAFHESIVALKRAE